MFIGQGGFHFVVRGELTSASLLKAGFDFLADVGLIGDILPSRAFGELLGQGVQCFCVGTTRTKMPVGPGYPAICFRKLRNSGMTSLRYSDTKYFTAVEGF